MIISALPGPPRCSGIRALGPMCQARNITWFCARLSVHGAITQTLLSDRLLWGQSQTPDVFSRNLSFSLPVPSLPGSFPSQRSWPDRRSAPPAADPASGGQSTEPIREPAYGRLKTHSFIWWKRMLFKGAVQSNRDTLAAPVNFCCYSFNSKTVAITHTHRNMFTERQMGGTVYDYFYQVFNNAVSCHHDTTSISL